MLGFSRYLARRRINRSIALWYHPRYAPQSLQRASRVPNLQLERSELVIEQLAREGLLRPGDVRAAQQATTADLLRVHSYTYLQQSARPELLARVFGLAQDWVDVDELLDAQRLAVGGTMAAAFALLREKGLRVGINLGGGFHHASPDQGSGFCVYNDVAVSVAALRATGFSGRVAIIDLDFHQGDGNLVTFADDPRVLTFSIHGAKWSHVEAVADQQVWLPAGVDDRVYLRCLQRTLGPALDIFEPEIAFYVAGNDVLEGDSLGTFSLSPQGALERDRHVVEIARRAGVPLAVTLGGGYSNSAWQCTANMLRWMLGGQRRAQTHEAPNVETHYGRIFRSINTTELQRGVADEFSLTEEELMSDLASQPRRRLLLDYYSVKGVEYALEEYGLLDRIRAMGFSEPNLEADPSDPAHQVLRVYARKPPDSTRHLLAEMVTRRQWLSLPENVASPPMQIEVLGLEWLLLQDPTREFALDRPRLPGQEHPGLGLAHEATLLLARTCERLGLQGVIYRPAHYHTAAHVSRGFHFVSPEAEGNLLAMRDVLKGYNLADASWLVERGRLRLADGTVLPWETSFQALPVGAKLREYFASKSYNGRARAQAGALVAAGLAVVRGGGEP